MISRPVRLRRGSALFAWSPLFLPAVALGIAAVVWARRYRAGLSMPRLPVRHQPQKHRPVNVPHASRLRRLEARAPEVAPPISFWAADETLEAEEELDDPAEIPSPGPSLMSEASQSAAAGTAAELAEVGHVLRW